ncbi:hypothetical protein C0Z20_18910 [Trinickia symbiotica]|uniref:Uncharacterized protein n=1 Tax=Trinickia symbiotica TaxID=863227 RepID=A0A2N7X0C5_9BURK|nr:hypothetical protein C0Z20_18910 [Trinickia symbiotica]
MDPAIIAPYSAAGRVYAGPRAFAAPVSSYGGGKVGIPSPALRHLRRACYTLGLVVEWKFGPIRSGIGWIGCESNIPSVGG